MSISARSCIYCSSLCGCTDEFVNASLCWQKYMLPGLKELQEGIKEWEESQQKKKKGTTLDNWRARASHFSNIGTKNNDMPLCFSLFFPFHPKDASIIWAASGAPVPQWHRLTTAAMATPTGQESAQVTCHKPFRISEAFPENLLSLASTGW